MFEFNPLEVGNPATLGMMEELLESTVNDCVDYIRWTYAGNPTADDITCAINEFHLDYQSLPKWLQEKFDCFDLPD